MRRSNTQPLSEILREFVEQHHFDRKLKEVNIVEGWEQLLGMIKNSK